MYHIILEDSNILDYVLYESIKEHIEDEMLGSQMIRNECSTDRGMQVWYELETDGIEDIKVVIRNCKDKERVAELIRNFRWFVDVDWDTLTVNVYVEISSIEEKNNDLIMHISFNIC